MIGRKPKFKAGDRVFVGKLGEAVITRFVRNVAIVQFVDDQTEIGANIAELRPAA